MFKIFYDDGSTYSGEAYSAPALGVQAIVQDSQEHGRTIVCRVDYYVLRSDGAWLGVDLFGLWDYLQQPGPRKVLFGRTIPSPLFISIYKQAYTDPDFLEKTGYAYREQIIND